MKLTIEGDLMVNKATKVKVYDAMMGSGKSYRLMAEMGERYEEDGTNFLYITPLMDECHRVAGTNYDPSDDLKRPIVVSTERNGDGKYVDLYDYDREHVLSKMLFKHPDYRGGNKSDNLKDLIKYRENIVSTHQLFKKLTPSILNQAKDYILVIDEALQVYEVYEDLTDKELKALLKNQILYVDEDDLTLRFDRAVFGVNIASGEEINSVEDTHYENLANLCDLGQLLYVNGKLLVWELSLETLLSFKEVWVATYLFEGSQMSSYFKGHEVDYSVTYFGKHPSEIKELINIYGYTEGMTEDEVLKKSSTGLNSVGHKPTSLSSSAINRDKQQILNDLRRNLRSYFANKVKAKAGDRLWTGLKTLVKPVGDRRYQGDWLSFNTKATNDYGNIHNIAYLMNLYAQPFIIQASIKKGYPIDQDMYALSEMVQWIWRSAIRNGEEINLYIPSSRMRGLLIDWLDGKYDEKCGIQNINW